VRSMLASAAVLVSLLAHGALVTPAQPALRSLQPTRASSPSMFFWQKKEESSNTAGLNARDADFARRQDKLAARRATNSVQPKGSVEITFPQKGGKTIQAKQGEPLAKVISRGGLRVKFDCKNGRCATCQVRLNGRSAVKICQGPTVPGGATRKLSITLDNP